MQQNSPHMDQIRRTIITSPPRVQKQAWRTARVCQFSRCLFKIDSNNNLDQSMEKVSGWFKKKLSVTLTRIQQQIKSIHYIFCIYLCGVIDSKLTGKSQSQPSSQMKQDVLNLLVEESKHPMDLEEDKMLDSIESDMKRLDCLMQQFNIVRDDCNFQAGPLREVKESYEGGATRDTSMFQMRSEMAVGTPINTDAQERPIVEPDMEFFNPTEIRESQDQFLKDEHIDRAKLVQSQPLEEEV